MLELSLRRSCSWMLRRMANIVCDTFCDTFWGYTLRYYDTFSVSHSFPSAASCRICALLFISWDCANASLLILKNSRKFSVELCVCEKTVHQKVNESWERSVRFLFLSFSLLLCTGWFLLHFLNCLQCSRCGGLRSLSNSAMAKNRLKMPPKGFQEGELWNLAGCPDR